MGPRSSLVCAADFAAVRRNGVRARSGPIVVSFVPSENMRLGIVITKRVGTAVQRNRLRRVIREFVRTAGERAVQGDCVIVPREGAAALANNDIRRHLSTCFERIAARMGG